MKASQAGGGVGEATRSGTALQVVRTSLEFHLREWVVAPPCHQVYLNNRNGVH